jgi:hypothetical protein
MMNITAIYGDPIEEALLLDLDYDEFIDELEDYLDYQHATDAFLESIGER